VRPKRLRALLLALVALASLAPLALLLVSSFGARWFFPRILPLDLTAGAWRDLFSGGRLAGALLTSVTLGLGTGIVAAAVALPIGRALAQLSGWPRHLGAACAFLPVAVPPIALATGLQVSTLRVGLGGSWLGVLLAHAVPAIGYGALYFLGVFAAYDRRIEDEARTLGARPIQVLTRVTLPLLRRPIAEVALLGFLISWAQVPLTLLVGAGAVRTLPIQVLAYLQAGQDRYAGAGAILLIVPAVAALAAVGLAVRRTEAVAL
jgi:putative spermidine/putrescine transport system permease protein